MAREYTVHNGVYTFPGENSQLVLKRVQRDRYGRIYTDADLVTLDGNGYLAHEQGDLGSGRFRSLLANQAARWNSGNPELYEALLFKAFIALREDPDIADLTPAPDFLPVETFLQRVPPPGDPVVQDLLERGGLYGLAAKPKVGKTILLLQLAVAVARGASWLGRLTSPGRSLMFQLEDSGRTLKRRLELMAGDPPKDFWLHVAPFKLVSENFDATLRACQGASLIICDPVILASEIRDWNSQQEVRDTYDLWRRLARDTGAAVVAAMHHRKMEGDHGDQLAGSIQAQATVDGILELYRDRSLDKVERRLSFVGRDWADVEDEVIRLNPDTLTWQPQGTYQEAKEEAQEARRQAKADELLNALPTEPPGLTYVELETQTGHSRRVLQDLAKALGSRLEKSQPPYTTTSPMKLWKAP